ncbi:MAG: heavy metal translocating P-type ATPase [Culicoidibacterales bacterium]
MNAFFTSSKEFGATIFSGLLILTGLILEQVFHSPLAPYILILSFIIGGYHQAIQGLQATISNHRLNVELLMIIAAIGATIIGYWLEGAILIFIFSLSGALEQFTTNKSTREIQKLMKLQPTTATKIFPNGSTQEVDINTLEVGDIILALGGSCIPIDGIIQLGRSNINEAPITGEFLPKSKGVGDEVYGGTLNLSSPLHIKITKKIEDSLIRKIIEMVENAQQSPSKTAQFIDSLENNYVKIVLTVVIAMLILPPFLLGWDWGTTFYRAMVLLVVASPCALIASVKPATLAAISNSAKSGILIKGGIHLENLATIKAIAFDKTGTLTVGLPAINDIIIDTTLDKKSIYLAIYALESLSTHPLADAITKALKSQIDCQLKDITAITEIPGQGIVGSIDNQQWKIGNRDFLCGLETPSFSNQLAELDLKGKTLVYIQKNEDIIGLITLKDTIRPEAISLISHLNDYNISTIMITGDNSQTANHIAKEVGITTVIANTLPQQKVEAIAALVAKYGNVAMVGDGINDAPALALANVGIAMGRGSDIALDAADIILIHSDLSQLNHAYTISRKLHKIIIQNISFSLFVILLLILSNFFQLISLPFGVIGHEGSTILVILNGLRLLYFQIK